MKKFLWPVIVVLSALAVAVLVLMVLELKPHEDPLHRALPGLERATFVAGFAAGEEPVAARSLSSALPPGVRWRYFDATHAAEAGELLGLRPPVAGTLEVALVDRSGRVRGRWQFPADTAVPASTLDSVTDQARFHRRLGLRPLLHACLNGASAVLLTLGLILIRRRNIPGHFCCMCLAGLCTVVFLVSYLHYHYHAGSMPFAGQGAAKALYLGVLLTHTVLAALVAPLAVSLYALAGWRRFEAHRRLARWALPMWLYVSLTGVSIYLMLYVWFAPA